MNALQRRRFANSVYAFDVPAQRTLWFSVRGYGVIAAADLSSLEAFERDTRRDLARSGGPSLFRSACKGILRALARWRAATA